MVFYTKQNYSHNYLRDSMHTIQYRLSKHITWTSSRDHTTHTKQESSINTIQHILSTFIGTTTTNM